jgi:hypothetical protein
MQRRLFLKQLAGAVATVAIATHVPLEWAPSTIRHEGTLQILMREWHKWATANKRPPSFCSVSPEFFRDYEGELPPILRYGSIDNLRQGIFSLYFKCAEVTRSPNLKWGEVRFS